MLGVNYSSRLVSKAYYLCSLGSDSLSLTLFSLVVRNVENVTESPIQYKHDDTTQNTQQTIKTGLEYQSMKVHSEKKLFLSRQGAYGGLVIPSPFWTLEGRKVCCGGGWGH